MTLKEADVSKSERSYCHPRMTTMLATSMLGEGVVKYPTLSVDERVKMWQPMLGKTYHITAMIRNKTFTANQMVKVDSIRNVRPKHV